MRYCEIKVKKFVKHKSFLRTDGHKRDQMKTTQKYYAVMQISPNFAINNILLYIPIILKMNLVGCIHFARKNEKTLRNHSMV